MSLQQSDKPHNAVRTTRPREVAASTPIGELARAYNVTLRTLRFYEDRGLLVPKRQGTARLYSQRDRARLESILRLKNLGFTLAEIRDILAEGEKRASVGGIKLRADQVSAQIALLERQRRDIDGAISALRNVQNTVA